MTGPSLYELTGDYLEQMRDLFELELDAETLQDTLEGLRGDMETKALNVVRYSKHLEALAAGMKEAEANMAKRRKATENRAASLREYVLHMMLAAKLERIEAPELSVKVKKKPGAVIVHNEKQIPPGYMLQPDPPPPRPDKKAIADAFKADKDVAGCTFEKGFRLEVV